MTPDELWDQFSGAEGLDGSRRMTKSDFLAALKEYGESVRQQAVRVCHAVESVKWNMSLSGKPTTLKCAAAIEKMEIK